jgi:serine/threonine-protein kinase
MRLERLDELFHRGRELEAAEWEAFAAVECGGDAELEATLLRMLRNAGKAYEWFEQAENSLGLFWEDAAPAAVGPYRILRELGRGGMGTVYLAERDGEEFQQTVAVKCMRREGAEVLRRFLAERRILSRLEHPGIARLLDGGRTETGEPYLVMEYVAGKPLAGWASEGRTQAEKLRLFLAVGEAVEYAHRNLVVHRDLKPGNILVTPDGQPKLLDFGIAKLLDVPGDEATLPGGSPLTPQYAAPEQIEGGPITTLTDVYGLGALLFELLTGRRPSGAGLTPPAGVDKDLGHIACKALEVRPEDRYRSVTAMLDDVRSYQAGGPVQARGRSLLYRGSKLVRKHWIGVVFGLTLLAVLAGLLVQSVRLEKERDKAQQVSRMMLDLFEVSDPDEARGKVVSAREVLDRSVPKLQTELANQPELRADLLDVAGQVYHKLGEYERAAPLLEEALAARRAALGNGHGEVADSLYQLGLLRLNRGDYAGAERDFRGALAVTARSHVPDRSIMNYLALTLLRRGKNEEAELLFREALAAMRDGPETAELAEGLTGLGFVRFAKGAHSEAEGLFREALAIRRRRLGNEHRAVAETLNNLASVLSRQGRDKESEPLQQEAIGIFRKVYGDQHPKLATALNNLGLVLMARGQEGRAEELLRESLAIRRVRLGAEHPDLAQTLGNLSLLLQNRRTFAEAEAMGLEALAIRRKAFGAAGHASLVQSLGNLGQLRQAQGRLREAEPMLREALAMSEQVSGKEHPVTASCRQNLAGALAEMGAGEAETQYREALRVRRAVLPAGHPHLAYTLSGLGRWLAAKGKREEGLALLREALAIREKALPAGHPLTAEVRRVLEEAR